METLRFAVLQSRGGLGPSAVACMPPLTWFEVDMSQANASNGREQKRKSLKLSSSLRRTSPSLLRDKRRNTSLRLEPLTKRLHDALISHDSMLVHVTLPRVLLSKCQEEHIL